MDSPFPFPSLEKQQSTAHHIKTEHIQLSAEKPETETLIE
jgi:hypothetical protein